MVLNFLAAYVIGITIAIAFPPATPFVAYWLFTSSRRIYREIKVGQQA